MSSQYKSTEAVPDHVLLARVAELVDAVTKGQAGLNEFTMRVPAECDRDADLVLTELSVRYRSSIKRAEAAERERDRLTGYSTEQALLPSASFGGVRELVNDIKKDATDVGGCYEVSTGHLDSLFEAFTDAGACKLLNKFAIDQKLSTLYAIETTFSAHESDGEPISFYGAYLIVKEHLQQLRKQQD